ncbi:MAG TPA: hypothetical protein VI932_07235, partial [Bacteroidota bacterium]|nr:hypothetical protein [Bacteroidota bacterium]
MIVLLSLPVVLHGQTTWQGTVSSSWMNASNWNAGVPDSTISAIIRPGTFDPTVPVTGAYVASLDLDLNNNGVLNFENGAALTVHEVLTIRTGSILNLGGGRLYLKDDAIIHNAGSFNADSGTVEMSGRSWTNNSGAVFNAGSSTVIFNGIDQRIDGTIAFSTLVVRSVDTLSLTGTVTVTDSLHVVSGSTLHSTGTLSISPSAFIDLDSAAVLSITGPFNNDGTLVGTGTIVSTRPYLVGLGALNATTVDVFFDRSVDLTTAQTSGNYTISGGISVTGAARDGTNLSLVHLTVSTMTSNTQYTLTVNNVRDLSANPIASNTQKKFAYASSPQRIIVISGSGRSADVNTAFPAPFRSKVFDTYSLEMYLRNVTYTAPASGASGTFAGTGTNTFSVLTDGAGIAIGSTYTANGTVGSYFVTAAATGLGPTTSFSATNTLPTTIYTITATSSAGGSITPGGAVSVSYGSNQSFTIAANATYHIDSVKVDGVNQGAITAYTFTYVTANHTIAAYFSINTYTITASAGSGGTISPSGAVSVNHGSNQSFTISPNTGYHIDSVKVDGVNQGAIAAYTFTNVTAGHTIAAYFSINTYTITATAGAGGTISPSGAVSVNHGSNQSFTIAANATYHIDSVRVDGVNQGAIAAYTFTNVTAGHTIAAYFSINTYTITATASSGGSISPS